VLRSHLDGKYEPKANANKDADKKAA
jgi:hypothetical protein